MADKLDGNSIVANTIPGTKIQSGTITTTQLSPSIANVVSTPLHPKISSIVYPGNDTAANTGGGDSIIIRGSGFGTNVQVYINGSAAPSITRNNANAVTITTAAQSAGTYLLYLINTDDGGTAILVPGIQYSGMPTWVTTSPLTGQDAFAAWSISLSATGDSPITYSLQAGSSLPAGITLAANGLISGTMTSVPSEDTTYNFTVVATDPQSQDTPKAFSVSVTVAVDGSFNLTTLLLQADGTNNGNNHAFLDSSNNNYTITRNGNVTQGSFSPTSPFEWGILFDNGSVMNSVSTGGKYLRITNTSAFNIGTGDFTLEGWIYPTSLPSSDAWPSNWWQHSSLFGRGTPDQGDGYNLILGATKLIFQNNDGQVTSGNHGIIPNQWYHVAASRVSGTFRLFVNGIVVASTSSSFTGGGGSNFYIGGETGQGAYFNGTMSNIRLVVGTGLYSANFTPSTTPLTAVSGTALLVAKSNRYVDISSNAFAITPFNTPAIQPFSPFAGTTAYVPATHGGSAFFDGSGDYLTATSPNLSGTWTVEFWWYPTAGVTTQQTLVSFNNGGVGGINIWCNTSGQLVVDDGQTGQTAFSSVSFVANQWHHVAIVRNGTTTTGYINGVAAGSNSFTPATISVISIGRYNGSPFYYVNGYISGLRLVNGTAVYTSAFTPPTSPPSNIANTAVLCNFTNAQIYDAAADIVLETVGDAKVNTAIKKYGTGSIYFDGTGDWLAAPLSEGLKFGTGDFTIEGWFYNSASQQGASGIFSYLASTTYFVLHNNTSSQPNKLALFVDAYSPGTALIVGNTTLSQNVWYHFALTRASGIWRLFVNGNLDAATYTNTAEPVPASSQFRLGLGNNSSNAGGYTGYIDDFRITKGRARYIYNFIPPTRAFANKGGTQTLSADEYFDYTTLLLPGNGTNNQNNHTFLDSSNNNFAITRNGNATQGTFSPFSQTGWSVDFTSSPYLTVTNASAFDMGTGDFAVEFLAFPRQLNNVNTATVFFCGTTSVFQFNTLASGTKLEWYSNGNPAIISQSYAGILQLHQWNHFAVVRTSGTTAIFLNGIRLGTASDSTNYDLSQLYINYQPASGHQFDGYISNFRVIKGAGPYSAASTSITVPTSPLTAVANTVLLTCQGNRFVDSSNTPLTVTVTGSPTIQAFSPFNPTASYVAANVGGSGYFDGTGDYLSTNATQAIPATGDFTIEAWVYSNVNGPGRTIVSQGTSGSSGRLQLNVHTDNTLQFGITSSFVYSTGTVIPFSWNYVAVTRTGSSVTFYINGVNAGSGTLSGSVQNTALWIGSEWTGDPYRWSGYISSVRISNSIRSISAATSPFSADANTVFLANFTNAGITDATAKSVFENRGDSKISTTQSKFGGSSMYFDGTGDYLVAAHNPNFEFGSGDFTIEAWVYPTSVSGYQGLCGKRSSSPNYGPFSPGMYNGALIALFSTSGSGWAVNATGGSISVNTWSHIAFVRFGTVFKAFLNGIEVISTTLSGSLVTNTIAPSISNAFFKFKTY
jgi:hypothetical protein